MTQELMARLVEVSQIQVAKVAITQLHETTFYATLWVHAGDHLHEVDARPSDALSLALRVQAPIFVAAELFEQQSLAPARTLPEMAQRSQELDPPGDGEIEWRSLHALLCGSAEGPVQAPAET
jgi:bifunctional DNase/RNase